jgi:hypothetical protein
LLRKIGGTVVRTLSYKVHEEVKALADAAIKAGTAIRVYAEAERIRLANLNENIALEDIVDLITRQAGRGFELNLAEARDAILGEVDVKNARTRQPA